MTDVNDLRVGEAAGSGCARSAANGSAFSLITLLSFSASQASVPDSSSPSSPSGSIQKHRRCLVSLFCLPLKVVKSPVPASRSFVSVQPPQPATIRLSRSPPPPLIEGERFAIAHTQGDAAVGQQPFALPPQRESLASVTSAGHRSLLQQFYFVPHIANLLLVL
jgi:hypothetical protein